MIGIYKITSPSNKINIGQSTDIEQRKKDYSSFSCKGQPKLYNSLVKHGFENHTFEIIEECSLEQLDEREIYWGEYFDTLGENGLNLRLGKGRGKCSDETKQKISKSKLGKSVPKLSEAKKGKSRSKEFGLNHSIKMKNKILANEHKQKIGKGNSKPVIQYDLKMNPIKEWFSATEIELFYKGSKKNNNVTAVCRGEQKTAYGYIFKYKNNE